MRHLKFFRVDPLSAKDRLLPHNDGLSIPFSPSFSGIVVTSDFQVLRMQPFLSGIPPVNGRYEHPLGERVPKAVLFSKLHEAHNNAYTRPFGATCSVHDTCCSTQNSNHCYKSDLEDISMDETVPESKCEKNREVRDIIEASSPRKDHLCCWRVSQFLYDQCCYVSFDPDMDSWLIEKRLAALHDTDASLYTCTCRSPHLHDIAEDIPHFAVCPSSRVGNCRNIHSKHYTNVGAPQAPGNTCCLCSVVTKNNSTYDEPEKRDTAAQDPFDNALGGRSLVPLQQSEWKRLLQSPSSTLEKKIRETLREYIFLSPEVLFQPKVILSSVYNKHLPLVQCENTFHDSKYDLQRWFPTGIAEAILSILNASPIDLRRDMYSNIILLGSMATLPFLPHRLVIDIQTGVYKRLKKSIVSSRAAAEALSKISLCVWTPVSHIEARYALWIGLNQSLKETCDTYGSLMSLTRDQYDEGLKLH